MRFFPARCYLVCLRPKFVPHHPVLENPQLPFWISVTEITVADIVNSWSPKVTVEHGISVSPTRGGNLVHGVRCWMWSHLLTLARWPWLLPSRPEANSPAASQPTALPHFLKTSFSPLYFIYIWTKGYIITTCSIVLWSLFWDNQKGRKPFAMTSCLNHVTAFRNMGKWPPRQHLPLTITPHSHAFQITEIYRFQRFK